MFFQLLELLFLTGYLANNSFPKPLSKEEETYYFEQFKKGDISARNILIERNLRLVAHIAKKYENLKEDTEDLISIGTIGLIKGIMSYDIEKGNKLVTYIARCIENEILMNIRATKKQKKEISLNEPLGIDREGNEINLIDVLYQKNESIIDQIDLKIKVQKLYKDIICCLTKKERLVIELRYGLFNKEKKTQKEIADLLGISRSYVSRIETKALKKLNKEMKEE